MPVDIARAPSATAVVRLLPVLGAPLDDGRIAPLPVPGVVVEAPRNAGPRAFALRVCRPSLGPGLPGHAVLVADPDARSAPGHLALVRDGEGWRLLATDGTGRGLSLDPELSINLDEREPADIAAVLAVLFP